MMIKCFPSGQNATNCYVVYNEESKNAFCVDVSDGLRQEYFDFIKNQALNIRYLLLTHGHYDHTLDIRNFTKEFPNANIVISQKEYDNILSGLDIFCGSDMFVTPDTLVIDGDIIPFEDKTIRVLATPGHTSGSVCYIFEDSCFCGDTVFYGSIGRTDLPTGSFFEIIKSVQKIKALGSLKLYPGHMNTTDIETQKEINPYFQL